MIIPALKQVSQRVSRLDRMLITIIVLLTSVFPVELFRMRRPCPRALTGNTAGARDRSCW